MKTGLTKRVISILLITVMLLSFVPNVFADYDDGRNCDGCGHYHWDEYMCGMCGYCSAECTDANCFVASHCNECGKCLADTVWCSDCMRCEDCYVYNGWHCLGCNDCHYTDEESLCGLCWFCDSCMGAFCDDCGLCEGCQELDGGVHCPECQNCYASAGACENGGEHCKECCLICEACDMCVFDDGLEICSECNLCELCCKENAQAQGCDCGEYCVEQSEWFEHICPDCGVPYCNIEKCELCGLCLDCCEGNSDCSDGMCVMDPEYDEHFCNDCGECTHNVDLCSVCYDAGELRCEDCSVILAAEEGCDCGDTCVNDPNFDMHIAQEHFAGGAHDASPKAMWMFNENFHWHECKYCDDAAHSKLGVNYHDYNNYGVCKTCGFSKNDKILILKQPTSRVCNVSDNNAESIWDPLYPYQNSVTFTVAAKGLSELSYQWYYSYGSTWMKCTDITVNEGGNTVVVSSGSKTNKLVTDVPPDICYNTCYYKCVITDEEGNSVETAPASIRSRHIYKDYVPEKLERIGDIYSDSTHFVTAYKSTGHYTYCVGDGCEEKKLIPHNFEKTNTVVTCYYTKVEWIKTVCKDCGYEKYIKNHDHYFIDPKNDQCDIDYSHENNVTHKLQCLFEGCDKTTLEPHTFMSWANTATPYNSKDGKGAPYKECYLCSYQYTKKPQRYDKAQGKNVSCDWTKQNDLVNVKFGNASSDIVYVGDEIIISFEPTVADKTDIIKMQNPRCVNWNVYYYCNTGSSVVDKKVSGDFIVNKVAGTATWKVKIPNFADRKGGGIITFEPIIDTAECSHKYGTRISGAYEPVCILDGYTGDTVCVECGMVVKYGEIIDGGSEHEGELVLNPLTVREGTCEHRGYSGTSRCSVCHMAVRGKSTPKVHTGNVTVIGYTPSTCYDFGMTGDSYCECGAILKHSKLIAPEHKNTKLVGYVAPTSSKDGYSGDTVCTDCDVVLKYGYILSSDKIASVITIDDVVAPIASDNPTYSATIKSDGIMLDKSFATLYIKNGIDWKDRVNSDYLYPHNTFKRSMEYIVTVRVKTNNGNIFAGDTTATVNGQPATVIINPTDPSYATVTYEFPYTAYKKIENIYITDVAKPIPGTNPSYELTLDNPYLYEISEVYWTEDGEGINSESVFKSGKKYKVYIQLEQYFDKGTETAVFGENVKAYINGKPATMESHSEEMVFFGIEMDLGASISGTVSSVYDANDKVTVRLYEKGKVEPAFEYVSKGNRFDYEFANIPQGVYTLKATKNQHKVYTSEITVLGEDIVKDITLLPIGKHSHTYDNDCDTDCNGCGEVRATTHKFGEYVYNNDATEEKDGTKTRKCPVCGRTETVTATGTKLEKTLIDSTKQFKDVPKGKWFVGAIDYAVTHGIFSGTSTTTFEPNKNMSRAQFVQVFANLSGVDTSNRDVSSGFSDVPKGKWFTGAVTWAAQNKIVNGVGGGKFDPNANVTREQMCVMLVNYVEAYKKSTLKAKLSAPIFADDSAIAKWAKTQVYKCANAGLVNGVGGNKFDPKASATRAQGATIFSNFHKEYLK